MWESFTGIASFFDPVSAVVGVVGAAITLLGAFRKVVFRECRRWLWIRQARKHVGQRPVLLVVDFLPGKNIDAAVALARQNTPSLRDIPDERVIRINIEQWLTPDAMPKAHGLIHRAARDALATGADVIHLFYAGPCIGAALVGAELANTAKVLVYQHDQGAYRNFGPLRLPRGLD